jgi:diguanylate cyclase (GGDEF)-like protein/PAS domain S-box-containing protein
MSPATKSARAKSADLEGVHRGKVIISLAVLIGLVFAVDVNFPFVAFGGFYTISILISLWLRNFRVTLGLTVLCSFLSVVELPMIDRGDPIIDPLADFRFQSLVGNHLVQVASLVVVCLIGYWRLRDERELEESRETNAATLASIAEGVITVDASGRITYLNRLAEQLTACSREQALGQPLGSVLRLSEETPARLTIEDLPAHMVGPHVCKAVLTTQYDEQMPIEKVSSPLRDPHGSARGAVIVFRDITERVRDEKYMRKLAYRDTLTNLPNRLSLHELLNLELAHARRNRSALGVLFIDLDDFKRINDTVGHAAGDEVLRATAARLRSNLRETDTIARLGGDEFAVLLPGALGVDDAQMVAEKLLGALDEPVLFEGHKLRVRASIGLAMYPGDADQPDELLRRADEAMYKAKQQGGARLASVAGLVGRHASS